MLSALFLLASSALANPADDIDHIKSMAGCFEVTFQYVDTKVLDPRYTGSAPKHSTAIEWVVVDGLSETQVELQHVLVSGPAMIKHWRQVWTHEGTAVTQFMGGEQHLLKILPSEAVKGRWTQVVTNVDDAPRYGCSGDWQASPGGAQWRCTVDAPLPRREKDHRHEYDLLERTNIHRIVPDGWDHDQYNDKIRLEDGTRTVLAKEYGHNTYRRVADEQCAEAIAWWPGEQQAWAEIRKAWAGALGEPTPDGRVVVVDEKRGMTPLWVDLFWMARQSAKKNRTPDDVHARAVSILEKHVSSPTVD